MGARDRYRPRLWDAISAGVRARRTAFQQPEYLRFRPPRRRPFRAIRVAFFYVAVRGFRATRRRDLFQQSQSISAIALAPVRQAPWTARKVAQSGSFFRAICAIPLRVFGPDPVVSPAAPSATANAREPDIVRTRAVPGTLGIHTAHTAHTCARVIRVQIPAQHVRSMVVSVSGCGQVGTLACQ